MLIKLLILETNTNFIPFISCLLFTLIKFSANIAQGPQDSRSLSSIKIVVGLDFLKIPSCSLCDSCKGVFVFEQICPNFSLYNVTWSADFFFSWDLCLVFCRNSVKDSESTLQNAQECCSQLHKNSAPSFWENYAEFSNEIMFRVL